MSVQNLKIWAHPTQRIHPGEGSHKKKQFQHHEDKDKKNSIQTGEGDKKKRNERYEYYLKWEAENN